MPRDRSIVERSRKIEDGELTAALVALYRERHAELRRDPEAREWGGLRREAAMDVLGEEVRADLVDDLLDAAKREP